MKASRKLRALVTATAISVGLTTAVCAENGPVTKQKDRTHDPHYVEAGFFDIHVCNWHDRPNFFLALFSTYKFNEIKQITIYHPDGTRLGELDLLRYRLVNEKNKPEKRVFMTQLFVPDTPQTGWYWAEIVYKDGRKFSARDYVEILRIERATGLDPADNAAVPVPEILAWNPVPGAMYYKVFVRDLWDDGKLILESKLIETPEIQLPKGLLKKDGWYAWRVHARHLNDDPIYGDFNQGSLTREYEFTTLE